MKLRELFEGVKTNPNFTGFVVADNMVLAVDVSTEQNADVDDYAVAQEGLTSTTGSLSPEKKTKSYIRGGKSSTKTGNQRTVGIEADRYIGDEFQDFVCSHEMKYATGQKAVVNYVYFNMITGEGEKGKGTLLLDTDASGNAEDNLGISGSFEKTGAAPVKFTYHGLGGYNLTDKAPEDWSTAYKSYFERKNGSFTAVSGETAPDWKTGTYYSKEATTATTS